ncbi:Integrase catalytic domain-containing protein [Aphis craccivora]|uniref:Integrase catalytic domain-containing protein n=1 Tax=Aphis craccivora TaxID=307492 RepID=A0A6G0XH18_APHCR|nr:Integrase catalytic domain-containing protein [Aphis craccivora]
MAGGDRDVRAKERTVIRRDQMISRIRQIHKLATSSASDQSSRDQLAVAIVDLDTLWSQFEVENSKLLEILSDLDQLGEYSLDVETNTRSLVIEAKAVCNASQSAPVVGFSAIHQVTDIVTTENSSCSASTSKDCSGPIVDRAQSSSKLPDIPLPYFDGECQNWPVFRDRFRALVDQRPNISNIEKFYYLLGCLNAGPQDVVKGFTVSSDTYTLAWDALVERYDRPRKLASSILDKLAALQTFLSVFDENIAILESLQIPDLSSFLLFTLAARCLPVVSKRLFETENTEEYPSIRSVIKFVKLRMQVIENAGAQQSGSSSKPVHQKSNVLRREGKVALVSTSKPTSLKCVVCSGAHQLADCLKFKSWSVDERYKTVCTHRLCMVCFGEGHMSYKCPSSCAVCKRRHHALLHRDPDVKKTSPPAALLGRYQTPTVLLGTAVVHVRDTVGICRSVRVLIDSASQISAITSACCDRLGLQPSRWTVPVTGLSGQKVPDVQGVVQLTIQPRDSPALSIQVKPWVLSSITTDMPARQLPVQVRAKCDHLSLADPHFDKPAPVDLLIGADIFPQIWKNCSSSLGPGFPSVYSSIFGWVLIGPILDHPDIGAQSMLTSLESSMETIMDRFWSVEDPEAAPPQFTENGMCEELFRSEMCRDSSGRFSVPLPFRSGRLVKAFPGSRQVALNRFLNLERKLSADYILYNAYRKFMAEYEELGHMSLAEGDGQYFIPHHAVQKVETGELKLRVVFDASAKCHSGVSLNQCLLVGPKLQQDIVDVLVGFRIHRVAFTTDICKMYRQIEVLPQYRRYQYILWRDSPQVSVKEYILNTVTYGVNSAPYLALRVLRFIADNDCEDLPDVKAALYNQTYMDDICVGTDSLEAAKSLQSALIKILARSGLQLKKWASNKPELLSHLPSEDCSSDPLTFDLDDASQVLGMRWNHGKDYFSFSSKNFKMVSTKRSVLSMIARIFDPLGLLAPSIFYAKSIMQRVWLARIDWDDQLPSDLAEEWNDFYYSLGWLTGIKIHRYIGCSTGCSYELCGFSDASEKGYAAVAYLRVTDPSGGTRIFLIGSKTKLAPLKPVTVPRLELSGAVLLALWLCRLKRILENQLVIREVFAWSDSTIVLAWLNKPHSTFKTFVSNRVHQIKLAIPNCKWFHVSSDENPVDCCSRGLRPSELVKAAIYWNGPAFLTSSIESWPKGVVSLTLDQLPEVKPVCLFVRDQPPSEWFARFSSFDNMIRVVARLRRFVLRCQGREVKSGYLQQFELDVALIVVVKGAQRCYLYELVNCLTKGDDIKHKSHARLSPFLDTAGVIRVGGRLNNSTLSQRRIHPLLIPKESHLAMLIVRHWHYYACHASSRLLTAVVSRRFWIVNIRLIVHRVIRKCTVCVRTATINPQPIMADLPGFRVQEAHPFSVVGIDYAGPLQMKELSLRKARICKAVHLESVTALTTDAFLLTLDRFVARRGLPSSIHSDCGTNFVGAARQLRRLINHPDQRDKVSGHLPCEWHFNPPGAPHFGGIWEAAVKSAKSLLMRSMASQIWSLEEFSTVLCRVEAALNSRPLVPASSDPNDLDCLTLGHFFDRQTVALGSGIRRSRFSKIVTDLLEAHPTVIPFLLATLVARILEHSPSSWKVGQVGIVEVFPGPDKVVRVAKVLTSQGVLTRPVVKLVPLPTDQ